MNYEFLKLNIIDLEVAFWIIKTNPKSLRSFFEYLATRDHSYRHVTLDIEKLLEELKSIYAGKNIIHRISYDFDIYNDQQQVKAIIKILN